MPNPSANANANANANVNAKSLPRLVVTCFESFWLVIWNGERHACLLLLVVVVGLNSNMMQVHGHRTRYAACLPKADDGF